MARVHTQTARKDYPADGICKGDVYYKWTLRQARVGRGQLFRSKTYPKPWQLTLSPFKQEMLKLNYDIESIGLDSFDESYLEEIRSRVEDLMGEVEEALYQLPESLQDSHMLAERYAEMENWYSELEYIDIDDEMGDDEKEDMFHQFQACVYEGE
jgi:hypothetical protein